VNAKVKANPIDPTRLVEVRTYTDPAAGTIHRNIPVLATGERDPMRQELFMGSCVLQTPRGPMNVNFPIEAVTSLTEAVEKFAPSLMAAVEEMQNQALRNKIITGGNNSNVKLPNHNN